MSYPLRLTRSATRSRAVAPFRSSLTGNSTANPQTYTLTVHCSSSSAGAGPGPLAANLLDGRLNDLQDKDVAAPVAIYLSSIQVYSIDPETSAGQLALHIGDEAIEAAGVPDEAPVLLGEGTNRFTGIAIQVFRLTTGEFQLMTHYPNGTPYTFVWDDAGNKYHLP